MSKRTGYDLEAVRRAIPLVSRVVYLNTGSEGLVARPVEDRILEITRLYDEEGFNVRHILEEHVEEARGRLSGWLGTTPDQLAFTDNASHSVGIVTAGLDWHEGDEVLISDEEHPALLLNLYYLERQAGVSVRRFSLTSDPEELLNELNRRVTPRTQLITVSHVSPLTGTRVPVEHVASFGRERGIMTLIDGAQAVGQIPVNIDAIGCDFYVSNGHKWMHGPKGTGLLIVRRDRLDDVKPLYLGTGAAAYPLPGGTQVVLASDARRYEFATRHLGAFAGLLYAVEWLDALGWDNIEDHARHLTAYAKERVRDLPGALLRTPEAWEESSAMVGFSISDVDGVDLREWLRWEKQILARRVLEFSGLRLSVAYFTTKEELDLFFDMIPQYPKWPHGQARSRR